jgi:hypothetical protein
MDGTQGTLTGSLYFLGGDVAVLVAGKDAAGVAGMLATAKGMPPVSYF